MPCTIEASIENTSLGFADDSAEVSSTGAALILAYVTGVLENDQRLVKVVLTGHASAEGPEDYNLTLSRARAEATANVVRTLDVMDGILVLTLGRGEAEPIADNRTEQGRASNRRVDMVLHFTGCS